MQLNKYEKAKNIFQEIVRKYPDSPRAAQAQADITRINSLSLSSEERETATSSFESQHDNWLAVESGSANCEVILRKINNGQFTIDPNGSYTGTLEFLIQAADISSPTKNQSPVQVQVRLFNNKTGCTILQENIFDGEAKTWQWTGNADVPPDGRSEVTKSAFQSDLLFLPLNFMANIYSSGFSKEQFLSGPGIPIRHSSPDETTNIFNGEQQYLFLPDLETASAHYWLSAENGELRQIDFISPSGANKNLRYENYIRKEGTNAAFPRKFILTWKQETTNGTTGWEYTVQLTDVELNVAFPPERFL